MFRALVTWSFLALLTGCSSNVKSINHVTSVWKNPLINPINDPRIESPFGLEDGQPINDEPNQDALSQFCKKLNHRFSQSGMGLEEANFVYQKLYESRLFGNEPVGMPSPDDMESTETLSEFKSRVSVKSIETHRKYEFFLLKTGCGYTYYHGVIKLFENNEYPSIETNEVLHLSVPC